MKTYTKEEIKDILNSSDKAVEKGIVAIFKRQTRDEQNREYTIHHNNRGFNAFDAHRGSYYATWILAGKHLTGKHITKARKLIIKYAGQLTEIANKENTNKRMTAKYLLKI